MSEPNCVAEANDVEKPECESAPVDRLVIRLRERIEQAEDWASESKHRSTAFPLTQLSECCNADDLYLDAVGLLIEQIESLMNLSRELWGSRRNMAYGPNAERLMLDKYPWLRVTDPHRANRQFERKLPNADRDRVDA